MRYVDEILIILLAYVDVAFPVGVISDDNVADVMFNTIVDDNTRCFAHIVVHAVVTLTGNQKLFVRSFFDTL